MMSGAMPERATAQQAEARDAWYRYLMALACGQGNDDTLARMYSSWMVGEGALPDDWGLSRGEFGALMRWHFPGSSAPPRRAVSGGVESDRQEERAELVALLSSHRAGRSPSELWMAAIVATACLASDHLWQDLGLWCRDDLSRLMQRNFPSLADRNIHNMKWKKFLYKQLCNAEGIYVCRSPSCEVCADYDACFGPED